jgi:hypothetical protein
VPFGAECEGFQFVFRTLRILGELRIKRSLPRLREAIEDHPQLPQRWTHDIDTILSDAVTRNHPLLFGYRTQVQVNLPNTKVSIDTFV